MQNQLQHPIITIENVNLETITKTHQQHKAQAINTSEHKTVQKQKQQKVVSPAQEANSQAQADAYLNVQMLDYFQTMLKKHGSKQAYYMSYLAENAICSGIQAGQIYLSEDKASLDQILVESRVKQKEDKTKKQEQQQKKRALIQMQLKYLDMQITQAKRSKSKQFEDNQFGEEHHNTVFSKKQHQQFLSRIVKQRSELTLRKKSLEEKQKGKQEEQEKLQKISEEQQEQKQRQEKKKRILEKLEEQKVKHEQKIKEEEQKNRRLSELKSKKFLHEKIQEKYNTEVLLPTLEEKKKKLKEIREMSKAFNVQEINNHEKEYLKKREEVMSASTAKKIKDEWNYKVPEKSQRLVKLLQQEAIQTKIKMQDKKRKLEQKIQRQEQFASYLKQKYQPTVDPKKRQQIEQRMKSESKEQKPRPDGKTLGMNYLEQVKKQRKKSANSQLQLERRQTIIQEQQSHRKKSQTNYLNTRKKHEYEELRDKRIDRLINSETTQKSQKIMRLQMEANKLIEEQKRKEQKIKLMRSKNSRNAIEDEEGQSTHLLLASIKAKMGIIDIYSKD